VLAIVDIETRAPRAYTVATERMEYHALDPTIASDLLARSGILSSRTEDDRLWVVSANSDTRPAVNYIYDRSAQTSRGILRSELDGCGPTAHAAGTHHPRDGLLLVSYLTKPDTVAPPPMVHGGAFVATNTLRLPNADREEHLHRPGNACWLPVWKWPACGLLFCGSHHRRHRPHRPSHRCA
jgi:hypothetical protein